MVSIKPPPGTARLQFVDWEAAQPPAQLMMPHSPLPPSGRALFPSLLSKGPFVGLGMVGIAAKPRLGRALSWQLFTRKKPKKKQLRKGVGDQRG